MNKLSGSKRLYNYYSYNTTSGSKIFGSLKWEWDGLDVDVHYYYDNANGRLLATVNSDENTGICYTYDEMDNLVGVRPASYVSSTSYSPITNAENITYTYNSNNLLSSISTESTTYSFTYDVFGNPTSIKAGDNTVSSYSYNNRNGKLNKVAYSNGFIVEYFYNDIELLTEIWYTDDAGTRQKAYEYEYTASGQVHEFIDNINGRSTVYKYDNNDRLIAFIEYENDDFYHDFSSQIFYNDQGLLSSVYYDVNHLNGSAVDATGWSYFHAYDDSSKLIDYVTIRTPTTAGGEYYYYDDYDRVYQKVNSLYVSGNSSVKFRNQIDYTYKEYSGYTATSNWISTYTSTVNDGTALTYTFTYDQNGNITKIVFSTGEEIRYVYDDIGQLLREDNGLIGSTYVYTYDDAGNILTRKYYSLTAAGTTPSNLYSTYTYSYSTSAWGDLLTSYNGREITYDEIGNPLSYYNGVSYTFSWTGKELTGLVKSGNTYSFTYNDAGIRTTKTKNGVTTTYYLCGSQILAEETSGNITVYISDSEGLPLGMQYHGASYAEDAWDVYWYEKNIFGDVVAVYDEAGTKLISYEYDAYGRWWSMQYNSGYSTTAYNNPFRYRGYYYDKDLELYYLNSRYYDGYIGRFISADRVDSISVTLNELNDKNLYSYCNNNPVMRRDDGGEFWETIFDVISLGASIVEVCINPCDPWAWAGAVGDAIDLIPFVSGVGEATKAVKITRKIVDNGDDVIDAAKALKRGNELASDVKKATGSYEIIFESGKNYVGKGGFGRAIESATEHSIKEGKVVDKVTAIRWKSAPTTREAFIDEYLMQKRVGVLSENRDLIDKTYNKIWSPGRKYYGNK